MFADADVLRNGNEQLLDGLEEGIIILDLDKCEVLYHNEAANSISCNCTRNECLGVSSIEHKSLGENLLDILDSTSFANCDDQLRKEYIADSIKTTQDLKNIKNFISFQKIIEKERSGGFKA